MNTDLMLRVADYIEAHPDEFNMASFVNHCGTTFCIAGTVLQLKDPEWLAEWRDGGGRLVTPIDTKAAVLLGLTQGESFSLFYGDDWASGCPLEDVTPAMAVAHLRALVAAEAGVP